MESNRVSQKDFNDFTERDKSLFGEEISKKIIQGNYKKSINSNYPEIALIITEWNSEICARAVVQALNYFELLGIPDNAIKIIRVPGGMEVPWIANRIADSSKLDAILCFGAFINNESEYNIVSNNLTKISLQNKIPIINGILSGKTKEDVLKFEGMGKYCASSALKMISLKAKLMGGIQEV